MLETFSDLSRELASQLSLLVALIALIGIFFYIKSSTRQFQIWSEGRDIPDAGAWRYPNLYVEAKHFGPKATAYYLRTIQRLDVVFPVTFAIFFWLAFGFFSVNDHSLPRNLPAFVLVPLAVDFAENIAIRAVLLTPNCPIRGLATLVRCLVAAKMLAYLVMLGLLAILIYRWFT